MNTVNRAEMLPVQGQSIQSSSMDEEGLTRLWLLGEGRLISLGVATGRLFILERMTHVHVHMSSTNRGQCIEGLDSIH